MFKQLSDNLNMLMAKARLNSNQLARLIGIPATTIKRIRTNEQSNPTVLTLLPIANYFSLTVSQLLDCETINAQSLNLSSDLKLKAIPILSWQECLHIDSLDYSKINSKTFTEVQLTDQGYCLIVEESDLDFFPKSCKLIVEPKLDPKSGDYVIVSKSEQGIASIKKYVVETNQIYLKSLVEGLGIIPFTADFKILGVIVQYKQELKLI